MPYEWNDFSAGELSPLIYANKNIARVQSGLVSCVNAFPTVQGSAVKRQGSEYLVSHPRPSEKMRTIAFKFNIVQQYLLCFQDQVMFVMKDGGFVLNPATVDVEPSLILLNGASTTYIEADVSGTTAAVHGFSGGEILFVASVGEDDLKHIQNQLVIVDLVDPATFRLLDLNGVSIIPGGISASTGFEYYELYSVPTIYTEADIFDGDFDYDQSADVLFLTHPDHPPQKLTRTDHDAWTFTPFSASPEQASVTNLIDTDRPTGDLEIKYGVTAINDETGEESLVSSVIIELTDEPTRNDPGADEPIDLEWDYMTGATRYRVYRSINGIYGLLGEANWLGDPETKVTFQDLGDSVPLLEIGPPIRVDNTFDSAGSYPRSVALFQQRLWFGGTNDEVTGIYATRSGSYASFALEEITVASSPIAQVIASQGVQAITNLVVAGDLLIMTERGEWTFEKGDSTAISPSSGLKHENDWGSAKVKPLTVGKSALFVESSGRSVRDLTYSLQANGFDGLDLSAAADHLFRNRTVVDWCYARKPYRVCWMVMSDGSALSLTYDKEQEVFGWAQHSTAGFYESCASIREGEVDNIYLTVSRVSQSPAITTKPSIRTIERINMAEVSNIDSSRNLDCWSARSTPSFSSTSGTTILTDSSDSNKLKIFLPFGGAREYWPFRFEVVASNEAERIYPDLLNGSYVLTDDSAGLGANWYTINRWVGGHPTFSTETTDEANMQLIPVKMPNLPTERGQFRYASNLYNNLRIIYGDSSFPSYDHPPYLPNVNTPIGTYRPVVLADRTIYDINSWPIDEADAIGDDKAYSQMIMGYRFPMWIESLAIDPVDESASGLNIGTHYITLRVNDSGDFYYARANQDQTASPVTVTDNLQYYDTLTGLLKSASIVQPMLSKWDTKTGVRVISDDPFPLSVQGVKVGTETSGE